MKAFIIFSNLITFYLTPKWSWKNVKYFKVMLNFIIKEDFQLYVT